MVVRLVSCVYMNVNYMDWLTTRAFSYSVTAIWTERLSNEPRYQQWNSQPANLMLKGTSFGSCNGKRDGAPARYGWDLAGWRRSETWLELEASWSSFAATVCESPAPTCPPLEALPHWSHVPTDTSHHTPFQTVWCDHTWWERCVRSRVGTRPGWAENGMIDTRTTGADS